MNHPSRQNPGKDRAPLREHEPPDHELDRRMRGVLATWRSRKGRGGYASRAIANGAQNIQHPWRIPGRDIRNAIDRDVPLFRVFEYGFAWVTYAHEYARNGRRTGPWAVR